MTNLPIKRYKQGYGHCAICAAASVANFYDKNINYELAKEITVHNITKNTSSGLYSGQIGILLNLLGFKKVTIVSSNLNIFDFTWDKCSTEELINNLNKSRKYIEHAESVEDNMHFCKWLKQDRYENNLIIDYEFSKYIKKFLNKKKPLLISFNWTMLFKYSKCRESGKEDPFRGSDEEHVVVVRGYNKKKVFVCDSNYSDKYRYCYKKYNKGFYSIPWDNLMSVIGMGDVYLPDKFNINKKI